MTRGRDNGRLGGVQELPTGRWRARFAIDGRCRQKSFSTRAVAEAWLAWVAERIRRGKPIDDRHIGIRARAYAPPNPTKEGDTQLRINEPDLILQVIDEYAIQHAIAQVVGRNARAAQQRRAARAWARVAFMTGARMVSLVRGFIPSERMACGCPPDQVMPHSSKAHQDREKYDKRLFARLDEILAEYRR